MNAGRHLGRGVVMLGAALAITSGLALASWSLQPLPRGGDSGQAREPLRAAANPQEPVPQRHTIDIVARRYAFSKPRIEVQQDDLVKIVFSTEDIPHSFTIDEYRIVKRAAPGRPVTFEFRAEKAGTFVYYCNLTAEDGCKKMRGELVVRGR